MNKAKLLDLADRVEALTSADREVDAEIAALVRCGTDPEWSWALTNYPAWVPGEGGVVHLRKNGPTFTAPAYSASLDSAMSLVPPRHNSELRMPSGCRAEGYVWPVGSDERHTAKAATPALALVAAALRARAALEVS